MLLLAPKKLLSTFVFDFPNLRGWSMAAEAGEQQWCPEVGSHQWQYRVYGEFVNWIEGKAFESVEGPGRREAVKLLWGA